MRTTRAFSTSNVLEGLATTTLSNGAFRIERMPVFKSGTFKDSMGYQATWEPEHLEQMVFNFEMLRSRGILPNVPVRSDHRSLFGGGEVIGYITGLYHDQASGRLLADYEITEPEHAAKLQRGTYRARSAEVGMYETNDEALYWPVFMGFAFVDIPAVEGLYSKAAKEAEGGDFVLLTEYDKEKPVSTTPSESTTQPEGTEGTEAEGTEAPAAENTQPPTPQVTPGAGGEQGQGGQAGTAEHGAAQPGTFSFTVGGQPTTDFAAVQRHITALETAASEQRDAGRRAFVNGLASSNKILQSQVEGLTNSVLSMSDEQFGHFRTAYDVAPEQPLLQQHGSPTGPTQATAASEEIEVLRETVAMHRRSGTPEASIQKMPSYIRLQALEGQNPKE